MRVLITGSCGFLGKATLKLLFDHDVFEYDIQNGYDILDVSQLEKVFSEFRPESVIHLAACADLNLYVKNEDKNYNINVQGTRNIIKECEQYRTRLLFASTCCVYGNNNIHPSDESSHICPCEPYAKSKALSEIDILASNTPHCCMRLATFYGPNMRPELAPAIFIKNAELGIPIHIHGNGEQTRTMTYVDDIASGIVTILESKEEFSIVNITTEEITSVNRMIDVAIDVTNGPCVERKHIEDRPGQILHEHILSRRLQSMGWSAKTSFNDGMKKSREYFINNNLTWN